MKKTIRYLMLAFLCALSLIAVIDNGQWVLNTVLWKSLGFSMPPASAYYWFKVENSTDVSLLVTASLLNDRHHTPRTPRKLMNDAYSGRLDFADVIIGVGEERSVLLTSPADPKIGIVLITAISSISESGRSSVSQRVSCKVLSWQQLKIENDSPTTVVRFSNEDMRNVDIESIGALFDGSDLVCIPAVSP